MIIDSMKYFMSNYENINDDNFKGNKVGEIMTKEIPQLILDSIGGLKANDLKDIKGSIGCGKKAEIPWCAMYINDLKEDVEVLKSNNKKEKCNIFFDVVMFVTSDGKGLYLTLNQKYEYYKVRYGAEEGKYKAKKMRKKIERMLNDRGIVLSDDIIMDKDIDLRCKGKSTTGKGYEKSTIIYKYYDINNMPTDEEFINDIKNFLNILKTIKEIKGETNIVDFFNGLLDEIDSEEEFIGSKVSNGEKAIIRYFSERGISYIYDKQFFNDLIGVGNKRLRPDFIIEDKKIWIEYDGEGHYQPIDFGGKGNKYAREQMERLIANDRIKDEYAKANGWTIIRIPYTEYNNIENILDKLFKKTIDKR